MDLAHLQLVANDYKEFIGLVGVFATLLTAIATLVTAMVIKWQTNVTRTALEFQSYLGIESISGAESLQRGITILLSLRNDYAKDYRDLAARPGSNTRDLQASQPNRREPAPAPREIGLTVYSDFMAKEPEETRVTIYQAVSFLSGIAHLVNEGYLDINKAWSRYLFTYQLFYQKLYPWYIYGIRETRYAGEPIAYATFANMCLLAHEAGSKAGIKELLLRRQTKGLFRACRRWYPSVAKRRK